MTLAVLAVGWTVLSGAAENRSLERFLADLQRASDRNDRAAIAAMMHFA